MEECPACDGHGEIDTPGGTERCGPCRGTGEIGWRPPLHYAHVEGQTLDEIRANVRKTKLYEMGDCVLVWVNEGDLWLSGAVDASPTTTQKGAREEAMQELADQAQELGMGYESPHPTTGDN